MLRVCSQYHSHDSMVPSAASLCPEKHAALLASSSLADRPLFVTVGYLALKSSYRCITGPIGLRAPPVPPVLRIPQRPMAAHEMFIFHQGYVRMDEKVLLKQHTDYLRNSLYNQYQPQSHRICTGALGKYMLRYSIAGGLMVGGPRDRCFRSPTFRNRISCKNRGHCDWRHQKVLKGRHRLVASHDAASDSGQLQVDGLMRSFDGP